MDEAQGLGSAANEPRAANALAALAARVAELERTVAEMKAAASHGLHMPDSLQRFLPHGRAAGVPVAGSGTPPPPMAGSPRAPFGVPPMVAPAAPPVPKRSLESRLGASVFSIVGIIALLFATAYALLLAVAAGLIGPSTRVVMGLLAGAGVILWSERFRRKGFATFSYSLKAIGTSVLYLTLWAAFHLYHLVPAGVALVAMIAVTAWNAFIAWKQDAELLGWYALLGGFLTPLLLSTGSNQEVFLFTYLAALDLGVVLLMRVKPWRRLLLPAFVGTFLFTGGWFGEFFHRQGGWTGESWITLGFVLMFFAMFAVVSVKGWMRPEVAEGQQPPNEMGEVIVPVLLPLANAAFVGMALAAILDYSGLHSSLAFLMVGLAAVYLGLMRLQRSAISSALHLAIAVVFLTVAIPLKASGHTLTTAWLIEGLILFWVATRFEKEQTKAANLLRGLSACGYVLGLSSLVVHWFFMSVEGQHLPLLNHNLGAALVAIGALAGAGWLAYKEPEKAGPRGIVYVALALVDAVGVLLVGRELNVFDSTYYRHAFINADFGTAVVGLVVLAAVTAIAVRLMKEGEGRAARVLAAVTLVGFNLLTILSVEREIGSLWHRSDANLQRSLAISGFLMAYGAGLLAIGFWKRIAFVRWQALILLLFTICKVFLYDIGSINGVYRLLSLFGLGAVLLAVSFVYQKDLLGLKGHEDAVADPAMSAVPPPPPGFDGSAR